MNNIMQPSESDVKLKEKLEAKLKEIGIWFRFIKKTESTVHTVDAAALSGIPLHRLSKSLVARTSDGRCAALIIPGDMRVDYKEAAKILETKNVMLAAFGEAHMISGYPPGGTPAIGYEKKIAVVLDTGFLEHETLYCGGGATDYLLELKTEDVIRVNGAKVSHIAT